MIIKEYFKTTKFIKTSVWNRENRVCLTRGDIGQLTRYIRVACKHEGINNCYTKQGYFPEKLISAMYLEFIDLRPIGNY